MKFKNTLLVFLIGFCMALGSAQGESDEINTYVNGKVLNASNDDILDNVNIVNLNKVIGTITREDGSFTIRASVNDTLYFSYIGYQTINVRVTEDWIKYGNVTVAMTEKGIALEEVTVVDNGLTGYLEIDAKRAPIYASRRFSISGLPEAYEGGNAGPGAVSKVLNSIFNPADFLYNVFSKEGKSLRKVRQIKEQDEIRNLLQSKYDRETLVNLLQIDKISIDAILRNCQYSKEFIKTANDLQILDAISECYEEYKVLNKN
ncbi:carboxypeptidase-like regulatory domain-containing protein [Nonlabens ponticola]|uniref:Carboxypeptidase-like regulatory domain-containing protein n=1 Tax=Nonlabens ponticola TaxID=2496866 RepID=A0A3S9MZT8_9FLAO|nr:carboxypeptidase-like regulatory domain-containing protein [Nonlabens ponticola]AZQ44659.1 carboxypeptidase-like regulatory domain-containing protein [Nonlabens ponticola]